MFRHKFVFGSRYEGDNGSNGQGDQGGQGGQGGQGDQGDQGGQGGQGGQRTFTQEEVNRFLAEDRRKNSKKYEDALAQMDSLRQSSNLTVQEKEQLEKQIEELRNNSLTREEQLKRELDKTSKTFKKDLESLTIDRDGWKTRYTSETIIRNLTDAAVKHEAFSAEQVIALLLPNSRLVETVGEDGKPNGGYTVKVKFSSVGSDGQPVTLDLAPEEAVKLMREQVDKFGNLFKSTATGGLGSNNRPGGVTGKVDLSDPAAYQELRKKNPNAIYNIGAK